MATTTTNFNFPIPQSTDLVKDGATAIAALGTSVDTQFVDLKGGTTGQVLSKASGTDLDFTWVAQDDSNAIQNAIVDAKGDLIAASAADTPARLAVGNNGESLVADSSTSTGLRYTQTGVGNPIINSGVEIWQRGTADVTLTAATFLYWADRWFGSRAAGTSGAKVKYVSASGLDGLPNAFRIQRDSGNTATDALYACYDLETKDSVRYAGQTVTLSFYARAGANYSPTSSQVNVKLASGTGTDQGGYATTWTGSTSFISTNQAITTSWVRYSFTGSVASSATQFGLILTVTPTGTAGAADYADFTGFQIDLGSVAQPYRRAGNTYGAELAMCQRYYWRAGGNAVYQGFGNGIAQTTTNAQVLVKNPVPMRTTPTGHGINALGLTDTVSTTGITSSAIVQAGINENLFSFGVSSGLTAFRPYILNANNSTSAYIDVTAEL